MSDLITAIGLLFFIEGLLLAMFPSRIKNMLKVIENMSENKLRTKDEILDDICVLLGGRVSEEIFMNNITTGAYDDIQKLTELAYMFVSIYGMDNNFSTFYYNSELKNRYSENIKKEIDESVKNIINKCYKKTKELLNNKKEFVEKLAVELLRNETLNDNDLKKLLNK